MTTDDHDTHPFVVRMWTEQVFNDGRTQMRWHGSVFNTENNQYCYFTSFVDLATYLQQQVAFTGQPVALASTLPISTLPISTLPDSSSPAVHPSARAPTDKDER